MLQTSGSSTDKPETYPFGKVAECRYHHESLKVYYALVKRSGKQYRRSRKTTDRTLAERERPDFWNNVGMERRCQDTAKCGT